MQVEARLADRDRSIGKLEGLDSDNDVGAITSRNRILNLDDLYCIHACRLHQRTGAEIEKQHADVIVGIVAAEDRLVVAARDAAVTHDAGLLACLAGRLASPLR